MDNNSNEIYCTNCKNKISQENTFCSYCGNIVMNDINQNKRINLNEANQYPSVNEPSIDNNEKIDDGEIYSKISLLLFRIFLLPLLYLIVLTIIFPPAAMLSLFLGYALFVFGLLPNIIGFILGIIAISKYSKIKECGKLSKKRQEMNKKNTFSLVITSIYFIILIMYWITFYSF